MTANLDIILVGLNHKTASVEIRECLGFSDDDQDTALEKISALESVREVLLVSTCNRVEVLLTSTQTDAAVEAIIAFLADYHNFPVGEFKDKLYVHIGEEAVRHIFRVAASLDSMVVGEPQILGQIKSAY